MTVSPTAGGRIPGTEDMQCAVGLYEGERTFKEGILAGLTFYGVFGLSDIEGPCDHPPIVWCKWRDWGWLACDNPEHRRNAEVILDLTPDIVAFLVWQQDPRKPLPDFLHKITPKNPLLDSSNRALVVTPIARTAHEHLIKPIPQNKGNKAQRRAKKLGIKI